MPPLSSRRLRREVLRDVPTVHWREPPVELCPGYSCFLHNTFCLFNSCGPESRIFIEIEQDPEEPEVVLLRPEHLPRLRAQLHMELAEIDEIAQSKGEIESRLEELDSAAKELEKRAGER